MTHHCLCVEGVCTCNLYRNALTSNGGHGLSVLQAKPGSGQTIGATQGWAAGRVEQNNLSENVKGALLLPAAGRGSQNERLQLSGNLPPEAEAKVTQNISDTGSIYGDSDVGYRNAQSSWWPWTTSK